MDIVENIYPALTVICAVLLLSGVVLLVAPWSAPAPVAVLRGSFPAGWMLPGVLLWVGGALLLLLAFRSQV
jgi:hypothetical protein